MTRAVLAFAAVAALGLAACSDNTTDDVTEAPTPGAQPEPVSETRAEAATAEAALAFGMTRRQLEDADVLSAQQTDLGDVDGLVVDASGRLTHVVIELEGTGDEKVMAPLDQVRGYQGPDRTFDLTTDLTAAQLRALPRWNPVNGG